MKAIKMTGPVALAVLIAAAFVGAGSAMGESTALCKVDETPCAAANQVGLVHETSVGKAKFLTSLFTIECDVLFSGTISTTLASPLVITGGFIYTNCGSNCTLTEENGPGEFEVLREGHEQAKVTGEYLVHQICGEFIDCSYNGVGLVGTAKGPLLSGQMNGEVTLSEQARNKEAGGFFCPKTSKLDIVTTPLTATYITS